MAKLTVKAGSTSRLEHVFILDSASTTGAGKTGLTNASVTMYYFRPADTTATSVTLSAGTLGTWSSGGFKEVDATNMPGLYEVGMPNAVFAATFNHSVVMIKGTGIAPVVLEYNLVAYDPLDGVRLGLTALPNAACSSNASLITSGTGTAQLSVTSGVASANATQWGGTAVTGMPLPTASYTTPPTAASISTQVWSETTRVLTAGTNIVLAKTTNITGFNDITSQSVWDVLASNVTTTNSIGLQLKTNVDAATSTRSTLTAANVWSEALPGSYTSGQAGYKLNAAGSAADPWATTLPGSYAANTAGYIIGTNLNATVSSRSTLAATDVWSATTRTLSAGTNIVLAKGTGITGFNDLSSTNVSDAIWGSLVNTYDPTSGNTTATFGKAILKSDQASKNGDVTMYSVSGTNGIDVDVHRIANDVTAATNLKAFLNNTSTVTLGGQFNATGNAAVADKLLGRTISGGADGNRTVTSALRMLRNKFTASGTQLTVYAEDDTTTAWTSTLSTDAAATPITGSDPA